MNKQFVQIALFIPLLACKGWASGALKQVTQTASQAIDIEKEAKTFVENLVQNDSQIKGEYERLVAPVKEEAGSRYNPSEWWALLWRVPNKSWDVQAVPNTADSENIYFVGQLLWSGAADSRWANQSVVAQVHALDHQTTTPGQLKVLTDKLTLRFDGFVDLKPELLPR